MSATLPPIHPATADALKELLGRIVDDGIARFGGVDEFAAALHWYNTLKEETR
jgi:hypothetical protein